MFYDPSPEYSVRQARHIVQSAKYWFRNRYIIKRKFTSSVYLRPLGRDRSYDSIALIYVVEVLEEVLSAVIADQIHIIVGSEEPIAALGTVGGIAETHAVDGFGEEYMAKITVSQRSWRRGPLFFHAR